MNTNAVPIKTTVFAILLWVGTAAACLLSPDPEAGESSGILMTFPESLNGRSGESDKPTEGELKVLPKDTEFSKYIYYPAEGGDHWDAAHCSVIRTGNDRRSIHRPEICMQGQGWTITDSKLVTIPTATGHELEVTDLTITRTQKNSDGEDYQVTAHYVYWFVGKDRTTASNNERMLLTISDNLFRNINHRWAYASVMAYATDIFDTGPQRTSEQTADFIYEIIGDLQPQLHPDL